jgi:dTDP-4-amino-4,6-dideoxygalactose transaminase
VARSSLRMPTKAGSRTLLPARPLLKRTGLAGRANGRRRVLWREGPCFGDFSICEQVAAHTIALPFHDGLAESEVNDVCETRRSFP